MSRTGDTDQAGRAGRRNWGLRVLFGVVAALMLMAGMLVAGRDQPLVERAAYKLASRLVTILERQIEPVQVGDWSRISGLVVLGGHPSRYHEAIRLARTHAHLRIVISGPSDYEMGIVNSAPADVRARMIFERQSLTQNSNTYGNAVFCHRLIAPAPGERWLLVTSAAHMPRALGTFHKLGFAIEPWPVLDRSDILERLVYVARHEWLGLVEYWLRGRLDLFATASRG